MTSLATHRRKVPLTCAPCYACVATAGGAIVCNDAESAGGSDPNRYVDPAKPPPEWCPIRPENAFPSEDP